MSTSKGFEAATMSGPATRSTSGATAEQGSSTSARTGIALLDSNVFVNDWEGLLKHSTTASPVISIPLMRLLAARYMWKATGDRQKFAFDKVHELSTSVLHDDMKAYAVHTDLPVNWLDTMIETMRERPDTQEKLGWGCLLYTSDAADE